MDSTILFVATMSPTDVSVCRREPDGTIRRAEYANINWIDRFTRDHPVMVSLLPETDLAILNGSLVSMLDRRYTPAAVMDLTNYVAGYFAALKQYHGSNRPETIARPPYDMLEISEAIGVPIDAYRPEKSSANRLQWTLRLWERATH